VAVIGRPNVGKSTLTNALVGAKVSIVSNRPQTTRHRLLGIATYPEGQLVLVDTPACTRCRSGR
jgi:GTP-binding protein Era